MHKQHKAVEPEQMKEEKKGKPEETTHLTQEGSLEDTTIIIWFWYNWNCRND